MVTIAIDEPSTWPGAVRVLLAWALPPFQHRRLSNGSVDPSLVAQYARELDQLVANEFIVAYHCTRLTRDEIAVINQEGLRCHDDDAVRERFAVRVQADDLSAAQAERLLSRRRVRAESGAHDGKLWATLSQHALTEEQGFCNPLMFWGGEAILELNDDIHSRLATIGTACIVEFSAPVARAALSSIGQCMLERFLSLNDLSADDGSNDVSFDVSIPPEHIRRIVRRADPEFERLTDCSSWDVTVT